MSPAIHEQALAAVGLPGKYKLFEIAPDSNAKVHFLDLLQQMRSSRIHGLNVTIPYKHKMMSFVDTYTAEAGKIGAINTLYIDGDKIIGTNTDAPAFAKELIATGIRTNGNALILGAGGAAYAVAYTLLSAGWNLIVAARRVDQARILQRWFNGQDISNTIHAISLSQSELEPFLSSVNLVVNTTPAGMTPNTDGSP
jgi:shikimate dehydrogenase